MTIMLYIYSEQINASMAKGKPLDQWSTQAYRPVVWTTLGYAINNGSSYGPSHLALGKGKYKRIYIYIYI